MMQGRMPVPVARRIMFLLAGNVVLLLLIRFLLKEGGSFAVVLERSLLSYGDLTAADTHDELTLTVIPGVLRVTDLPELMARLAPIPITLVRPRTASGGSVTAGTIPAHLGGNVPANVTLLP